MDTFTNTSCRRHLSLSINTPFPELNGKSQKYFQTSRPALRKIILYYLSSIKKRSHEKLKWKNDYFQIWKQMFKDLKSFHKLDHTSFYQATYQKIDLLEALILFSLNPVLHREKALSFTML